MHELDKLQMSKTLVILTSSGRMESDFVFFGTSNESESIMT